MATLTLHPGKEKSVLRRHPWLFSGAIAHLEGRARPGDTVDVVSHQGRPLARAAVELRDGAGEQPGMAAQDGFFLAGMEDQGGHGVILRRNRGPCSALPAPRRATEFRDEEIDHRAYLG